MHATSDGPSQGCEFVVTLPLAATARISPASQDDTLATLVATGRGGRRVLVVDDNADAAEAMAMLLVAAGNDVRVAHDGVHALQVAEAFAPDTIFLDLGMPRLNGWETAQRIRSEAWGRDLLIVALTGWGQPQDRGRTAAAGFDAHLVKPVGEAELLEVLNDRTLRRGMRMRRNADA